jgi:glycosyltransferase involved in cell wall biosynthesis
MEKCLSVVIPANNEEALIGRLLHSILDGPRRDEIDVIVAANGCSDATAVIAAAYPGVKVVELRERSKAAAFDAADSVSQVFPRAYVDADVVVSQDSLIALADTLRTEEARLGCLELVVDTSRSNWLVKQYYRVWNRSPYRTRGHAGSGLFALSEAGRRRFPTFPRVFGDDRFVQRLFELSERVNLAGHSFQVEAPRTVRSLIRRGARIVVGNREVAALLGGREAGPRVRQHVELLKSLRKQPSLWPAFAIYYGLSKIIEIRAAKMIKNRSEIVWYRDATTRVGRMA